jgi:peroxiredoxin
VATRTRLGICPFLGSRRQLNCGLDVIVFNFLTAADRAEFATVDCPPKLRHAAVDDIHRFPRSLMSTILPPGTAAPDFELAVFIGKSIKLSNLRGNPVVLVFYPADWSPVCGDQLALYNEFADEFKKHDAQLVGISVDGIFCHQAYAKSRKLEFPLVSDFEPKGKVAKTYGAYRVADGYCERALYVIDKDGTIAWSYLSPIGENPGADGILEALEKLSPAKA